MRATPAGPAPFGSPLRAKFTQYDDMTSASRRSTSVHGTGGARLSNMYGISATCVAPRDGRSGSVGGTRVK